MKRQNVGDDDVQILFRGVAWEGKVDEEEGRKEVCENVPINDARLQVLWLNGDEDAGKSINIELFLVGVKIFSSTILKKTKSCICSHLIQYRILHEWWVYVILLTLRIKKQHILHFFPDITSLNFILTGVYRDNPIDI